MTYAKETPKIVSLAERIIHKGGCTMDPQKTGRECPYKLLVVEMEEKLLSIIDNLPTV